MKIGPPGVKPGGPSSFRTAAGRQQRDEREYLSGMSEYQSRRIRSIECTSRVRASAALRR